MIRRLLFGIFLVLCSCTSKNKGNDTSATNDSIKKYIALAGDLDLDFEKRKDYNDKAFSYLDLTNNDSLTRSNLFHIGINNNNLMQFEKLEKNSNTLYNLSLKSNDQRKIACAYKLIGLNYAVKSQNDKSIEYFYKSKKIFLRLNANKALIALDKDISQVQFYSCDFLGSNKTLFKSLEI